MLCYVFRTSWLLWIFTLHGFLFSLFDVQEVARAARRHWMVESQHWHLDVTFHEDANHTLEKAAAYGLNIIRKIALTVLKLFEIGKHPLSLKKKCFAIGANPGEYLESILDL